MNLRSKYVVYALVALTSALTASRLVRAAVPDSDITYNVRDALRADPRVSGAGITVTTGEGVVTLSGNVGDLAAKRYAVAEAEKINGVVGVVDYLKVTPAFRSDVDITHAVRRRILNSASIESQGLTVTTKDGVVTLSGTVGSYAEQQQAGLLASEVRGVKAVKNDIFAKWEKARSDAEIKDDAVAAIARDAYLAGLPITVSVQKGVVSLSGSVGNANERARAANDVRWIANVTGVKDDLTVKWYDNEGVKTENVTPSDEALKKAVSDVLEQDVRVGSSGITIRVSFGDVTLDGSVSSFYQKRIAGEDAGSVVGVAWVTNNLFVQTDQHADWVLADDVRFNLNTDAVTEGFRLHVRVTNGVVTLSGEVDSWFQRSQAYDIASRVRGVKGVINNITVSAANLGNTANWLRDAELVKAVKARLRSSWTVWWVMRKINVTVRNGVATLEGDVNTWKERQEAGDLALHTLGISEVDNRLTVKGVAYPWAEHQFKWPEQ